MRPLLVVLHERSLPSLQAAARFWDLPISDSATHLTGQLYPVLTDPWSLALALDRIDPLAARLTALLAEHRLPQAPQELARLLELEERIVLPILRQLYVIGIITSESSEQGPLLHLPAEIARIVLRLDAERRATHRVPENLANLLESLSDHEILELAETYGLRVIPSITTREEAATYLRSQLVDSSAVARQRTSLSSQATQVLDRLLAAPAPVTARALASELGWPFGDWRRAVVELARRGFIWRAYLDDSLAIIPLPTLRTSDTSQRLRPIAATPSNPEPPTAILFDLLLFLARVMRDRLAWPSVSEPPRALRSAESRWQLIRDAPEDGRAYLVFLRRCAGVLGLLAADGIVDRERLGRWLRLSFPKQGRRLVRAWRHASDQSDAIDRLLNTLRVLRAGTWYEWTSVLASAGLPIPPTGTERLARELEWLGILESGRSDARSLAVRLTSWGRWLLGTDARPPVSTLACLLSAADCPPLYIATPTPELFWLTIRLGTVTRVEPTLTVTISADSVAAFVRSTAGGENVIPMEQLSARVLASLERLLGQSLPPCWSETLQRWFASCRPVTGRTALLFEFATPAERDRAAEVLIASGCTASPLDTTRLLVPDARRRTRIEQVLQSAGFAVAWLPVGNTGHPRRRTASRRGT